MKLKTLKVWFLALIVSGCTSMCTTSHEEMNPEEVVEAYLDTSFNISHIDQISELIKFTSGNLKQALEAADAKTVEKVFVHKRYNLKRFSVIERNNRTPREVEITYELAYNDLGSNKDASANKTDEALVTAENTLNLIREGQAWYITDVIGGKTSIDFQVPLEIKPN